jgi:hypothetical protein
LAGAGLFWLVVAGQGWAQGIRPDYASTYGFAAALQADYAKRRETALQERCNRNVLSERCGAGFGTNKEDETTLIGQLVSSMASNLARELVSLKQYPHLVVGRIAAIRGKRTLESRKPRPVPFTSWTSPHWASHAASSFPCANVCSSPACRTFPRSTMTKRG